MKICEECKTNAHVFYSRKLQKFLCNNCYKYSTMEIHKLPESGKIGYYDGKLICHICGRAYKNLYRHIRGRHRMEVSEYKSIYKLKKGESLISEDTKEMLRVHVERNYETIIKKNLMKGHKIKYKPIDEIVYQKEKE